LNIDECAELIRAVEASGDCELLLFTLLAISTGARVSSILAIRGVDCDLENGVLTLDNIKSKRGYKSYISGRVKPLLAKTARGLINPYRYIIGGGNKPKNRNYMGAKMKKYFDRLFNDPRGIDKRDRKNRIVLHSLRHSFGSNLATAGVPLLAIARLMDHKNNKVTERYAKISEAIRGEAVGRLMDRIDASLQH
jgi:integrase